MLSFRRHFRRHHAGTPDFRRRPDLPADHTRLLIASVLSRGVARGLLRTPDSPSRPRNRDRLPRTKDPASLGGQANVHASVAAERRRAAAGGLSSRPSGGCSPAAPGNSTGVTDRRAPGGGNGQAAGQGSGARDAGEPDAFGERRHGGQVVLSLATESAAILEPISLRAGESRRFSYRKSEFELRLKELNNALIGEDFATVEISAVEAPKRLTEQEKIERLIAAVESLQGATFLRNGSEYSPAEAARHLREKRDHAGEQLRRWSSSSTRLPPRRRCQGRSMKCGCRPGRR